MTTNMPITSYEQRLDRIESKLDKVSEAITNIVRLEEKVVAGTDRIDRLEFRMDHLEATVDNVKMVAQRNDGFVKNSERLMWAIITAAISLAVYMLR
jgi:tetrahydromethanopterin S-methyltransferase subunit G